MSKLTTKMEMLLKSHERWIIIGKWFGAIVPPIIAIIFFGVNWYSLFGSFFAGLLISQFIKYMALQYLRAIHYPNNPQGFIDDTMAAYEYYDELDRQEQNGSPVSESGEVILEVIETSNPPIAMFMDAPIFEWISVKGHDGNPYKFTFFSTMDIKNNPRRIPEDCIMLLPGILYQCPPQPV